jgi:nucleotide-binding universal stress UspA family protein
MAGRRSLRVLVATDGSDEAQAAIATARQFPWPDRSRLRVVIARNPRAAHRRSILLAAADRSAEDAAARARRALSRRWPDVEVAIIDEPPVKAILAEASRFEADVIVLGWRGHGRVRQLLMGSVSRGVVRGAKSPVLVVRQAARVVRIVVGYDASTTATRALAFVERLAPPRNGKVILVSAMQLRSAPSGRRLPGAATIAEEIRRANAATGRAAMQQLARAAQRLTRSGWDTSTLLVRGTPLRHLFRAVEIAGAHLLVIGARGTTGVRYLLLGSVAEGALDRSSVPVLLVR